MIAGEFRPFVITCPEATDTVCIIAYHGDSIPEIHNRTVENYYRWEYDHGFWKDASNHSSQYIEPSQCFRENTTFHFYIRMDSTAQPGQWNIIILNKTKSTTSHTYALVLTPMNLFLTALMACYQPIQQEKKSSDDFLFCCEQKKEVTVSKQNINDIVDKILAKKISKKDGNGKEASKDDTIFYCPEKVYSTDDLEQTTITNYPRSKLKYFTSFAQIIKILQQWGGSIFRLIQYLDFKQFLTFFIIFLLLCLHFAPSINPEETEASTYPIIESFTILPQQIHLGDEIVLTAIIADSLGIKYIHATIENQTTLPLTFINGTIINNTYINGLWQNNCTTHGFLTKNYTINLTVTDIKNNTVNTYSPFSIISEETQHNSTPHENQNQQTTNTTTIHNTSNQTNTSNTTYPNTTFIVDNESKNQTYTQNQSSLPSSENVSYQHYENATDTSAINQTDINKTTQNSISIVDKQHEHIDILPGSRFYVERTIDGPHGTNISFIPLYSDSLILDSIEILDNEQPMQSDKTSIKNKTDFHVFNDGSVTTKHEYEIQQIKDKLPDEVDTLNKIACTEPVMLHSPRTIRLWFQAPSWDDLQNKTKNPTGEISYLILSQQNSSHMDFEGSTWWSSTWGYRKSLTLNSSFVTTDLINFPVLINITDTDLANHSQADGDDIAFILDTGTTQLNHEIEYYNSSTGHLITWINVTQFSSTIDTNIWMYYGNPSCGSQENPPSVWDSNYIGVWHFNDTGTGTRYDATSNNNDASPNGYDGDEFTTNGKIDGADRLDGTNDYLSVASASSLDITSTLTIEAWVQLENLNSDQKIAGRQDGSSGGYKMGVYTDNKVEMEIRNSGNTAYLNRGVSGGVSLQQGTWYHLVGQYSDPDNNISTFVNGKFDRTLSTTGVLGSTTGPLLIGREPFSSSLYLNGYIDELRISKTRRNSSWINTTYQMIQNPQTFLTLGTQQHAAPQVSNPVPANESTDILVPPSSFNITIIDTNADSMNITWLTNASGTWTIFNVTNGGGSGVGNGTYYATNTSWVTSFSTSYFWSVNVTDGTSWTNQTYSFTTRPENYLPTISVIYPVNQTIGVSLQPVCSIQINDLDNDLLNVSWYENSTGSWILRQVNNTVSSNQILTWSYTQVTNYTTQYYWKISINDSKINLSYWYTFTSRSSDSIKPSSNITAITPYWFTIDDNPLLIQCTDATDNPSGDGIKNVTLYYHYSDDNATWDDPIFFAVDEDPWDTCSWSFTFPNASGWYRFYSRAADNASPANLEDPPSTNDTESGYDTQQPLSQINTITPYTIPLSPHLITVTTTEIHSGLKNITLWYRYTSLNTSWWHTAWTYRKKINITNNDNTNTLIKNYSINLTFDHATLVSTGKSLTNGDDIRIIYSSGNNHTELDRINSTAFNSATTKLWFQLQQNISASSYDDNYYIYYGNPSAENPPNNQSNIYLWYDSFNRANTSDITTETSYKKYNAGTWSIENNKLKNVGATGDPNKLVVGSLGTINYDVEMIAKIYVDVWQGTGDTGRMGLSCCIDSVGTTGAGYCGLFHNDQNSLDLLNDLRSWGTYGTYSWSLDTWYNMKFRVTNPSTRTGKIKVWLTSVAEPSSWSVDGTFGTGTARGYGEVGITGSNRNDVTFFDDLIIRYLLPSEPSCLLDTEENSGWIIWSNTSNPDTASPWNWNFDFPNGTGYYQFYSIAVDNIENSEDKPSAADALCYFYITPYTPVINSYDLVNTTGSKLNNYTGLLDVNKEYMFSINITDENGWMDINYINVTAWYDHGDDNTTYNQTFGGNLNMYLQYLNTTGTAEYIQNWPDDEAQLIILNCSETLLSPTTCIVNISFVPFNQVRWASSNMSWNTTTNATNDPFSWNFNITVSDSTGTTAWVTDEYGVYKYATVQASENWVDVLAPPGFNDTSTIVSITYASNYDFNMSIYFEEDLTNSSTGQTFAIANNVYILAATDSTDDINSDILFTGIGEGNAVDIFNESGLHFTDNVSQLVSVQFNVYIPFGTQGGLYSAHIATKIIHD